MAQQNHEKENAFAKQIFAALQTNNFQLYRSLYPNFEEYKELMQMMLAAKMADLTQEKINGFLEDYKKEADSTYRAEFNMLLKQADSVGITWSNASFFQFESIGAYPENFPRKYINGDIHFKSNNASFIIEGVQAVELPQTYKLQEIKGIRKE